MHTKLLIFPLFCIIPFIVVKRIFILVLILSNCIQSFAQNGFLFQPQIGFGVSTVSNLEQPNIACDCGLLEGAQKQVSTFNIDAKLGYEFNRIRFSSGLEFLRTGPMQNISLNSFPSGRGYTTPVFDNYSHYDHLLIPISIGYNITLIKKWSFTPELGTHLLFIKENSSSFSNSGNFLFSAKLNFEKEINQYLSIVITPAYYNIIAPVYFHESDNSPMPTFLNYRASNHLFLLQCGVQCRLPHKAKNKPASKNKSKVVGTN